jgi:hypothetical protein
MDMSDAHLPRRRANISTAPNDARSGLRLEVEIDVTLSGSSVGRQKVELRDISVSGCRIACVSNYPVGTTVIVNLPGLAPIGAQVRWSDIAFCGLRFNAPIHPLVVERVMTRGTMRQ